MDRILTVAALAAALAAGPAWADARSVINGVTYEVLGPDAATVDARDGIVRMIVGDATVTVTRAGTFIGVARVAGRPRSSLRLSGDSADLSVSVDGVVVWQGQAG